MERLPRQWYDAAPFDGQIKRIKAIAVPLGTQILFLIPQDFLAMVPRLRPQHDAAPVAAGLRWSIAPLHQTSH